MVYILLVINNLTRNMTILNIPPSSIALFSIFLFNCVNAIIGYSTNVLGMSVFHLMFIQSVSTYLSYTE
jgi:hypothetical protein